MRAVQHVAREPAARHHHREKPPHRLSKAALRVVVRREDIHLSPPARVDMGPRVGLEQGWATSSRGWQLFAGHGELGWEFAVSGQALSPKDPRESTAGEP